MSGETQMKIIKVAASSRTPAVAGAIAGIVREEGSVEVQAIGASAVNRAVKSIVMAQKYLRAEQKHLYFHPRFTDVLLKGQERTVLQFVVESFCQNTVSTFAD